ncbi:hypothetical protein PPERSA_02627 [Pseudocohnilembus persalinus]|uniref:Uncharacterized protein n=1 Tax=Pseudocohnilembus persalinus TaxID=266149 RepID=A0A0V0R5J9_PSEPJ|nr:hypothetical protein PPERSA_02627 [Pseudocohnilembus persalinus]|eukprot:KRX09755.1 hypothetical protein PPERSA_02627 [Pseudocohnilembus persalinus]
MLNQYSFKWYSLAEYLYAENLVRMLNPETQETESQEQLLFHALKHAVEGANKGMKANMNSLVLDSAKMVWNICAKLQDSAVNRRALIKPIFSTLYYLKTCKEKSEPDLILLLSQLLFKGCIENDENQIGENVCDMVFELIPKAQQKPIWEAKMIFMSQQGKNELQALQNMKEADASLQSKVQIRLARASNNIHKQCQAYQRGIEILKKENSVEIVEVYIEFSEWLLRNDYDQKDAVEQLLLAADTLIEIELIENDEEENEEDEEGDERGSTVFSRSIQNKKNSRISRIGSPSQRTHKSKQGSVAGQSMASKKKSEAKDKKQKGQTSRSSRTGGARATKTIKSKQAKSIFTQREEEPMPENLNCAHYERLMRIHSMLAMISQSQEEQLQYCLDAKLFLTKIFEVSFKTLNTMAQNAANYTSKIDQKIQEKEKNDKDQKNAKKIEQSFQSDPFKKPEYIMPQSLEEWINFQFSKDFLEKVQQQEDYNFMCKFLFEKTEITYKYVDQLIDMFERAGLHAHCIPLYVFMRFFAKEIMGNQFLTILQDFKYARVLNLMGYHEQANKIIQSIQMNKLKLSEQERKQLLAKTENSKIIATTKKINDFIEQYIRAPNLIKEFQPYQIWIQLSIELYRKGDLVRARDLLNEAYKHAQIIQNKQLMGEIHLYLGMVSYLEGDYKESLENHMKSHKLIKDILLWELSLKETYKCLKKLNKYEDMRTFLRRILEVFESIQGNQTQSLAQQNNGTQQEKYKQQQQQQAYSTVPNKLQIEQMLTSTYLHFAKLSAKLLVKNYSAELLGQMMEYVRRALVHMGEGSADAEHYEIFLKIVFKIQVYLEGLNLNDKGQVNQGFQVAGRMIKLLNDLSLGIKSILKYSLVIEKQSDCKRTPLMMIYYQIRVYLASLYSTQGVIKQIKRKFDDNFKESEQSEKGHEEEDEIDEDEERDTMGDNNQNNQNQNQPGFLQRYLIRLQRQIDSVLTAIPKSLQDFQKAAAILVSVKNQIPKDSYLYLITLVELTRAKRLQLEKDQLLTRLWVTEEEFMQQQEDEDEDDYKQRIKPYNRQQKEELQDSIQYCKEISDNYYQYLTDPFQSKYINHYLKKFSMEVAENFGKKLPDYCFQYLAKYQSFEYNQFNIDLLKKALKSSHKFITYQRINKHVKKYTEQNNEDVIQALKQSESFKLWNQIYDIPDYNSIITDYIPNQQVQMLLKLSEDKRFLYFSYMAVQKNEENEGKREYKWFCKKKALNMEQYHKLEELNQRISDLKKVLIKTPIQSEKEFVKKFFEPQEQEFVQILEELENFCQFFTVELEELLHFVPENQNEEDENQQQQDQQQQSGKAAKKEAKKEAKKDTKKKGQAGGKDDLPVYESPLGKTKTGYESVLLLVDLFLFNLPFEALKVFKDVPAVARDFSILAQGKRLQAAGFSPSANNSTGIEKDKIKYISYNFKNSQKENEENKAQQMDVLNAKPVIDQFMQKNANSLKIEGKVSSKRVTSLGEWQQYLQNGSMLLFYGNPGLLNILSPKLFVDMSELSRVKSVILLDKINAKKQVLEKFSSLEQDGEKTPVTDSFIITAAILSLLGVQSIGQTQWSVEAEQYPKMLENFLEGASQEIYLASTLQKFREPSVFYRDQNGNLVDPVQIQKEKEEKEKAGKGAKKMGKKEEKDKDKEKDKEEADQVQIQEEIVEKKMLHLYNMVFIGVPVVRVQ